MAIAISLNSFGKLLSNRIFLTISQNMHDHMVKSCVNAPITYFEENTAGTIMNRFSKDIKILDGFLFTFLEMTDFAIKCMFSTVILIYLFPPLIIVAGL